MREEAVDGAALLAIRRRGQHFGLSGFEGRRERAVRGRAVDDGLKRRQSGRLDAEPLQGRKLRPEGRAGGEPVSYRRGNDGDPAGSSSAEGFSGATRVSLFCVASAASTLSMRAPRAATSGRRSPAPSRLRACRLA